MEHTLKTKASYFKATWERRKLFEIRKDDRGFNTGDTVILEEVWDEGVLFNKYTGRKIIAKIAYVTGFEQKDGFVVFGIKNLRLVQS